MSISRREAMTLYRRATDGYKKMAIESDNAAQVFTGGIWYRAGAATWPFGHLRLDSNGVSGWVRGFGLEPPALTLRWEQVTRVEPVRGPVPLPNRAVRITGATDELRLRMTLWTGTQARAERVLRACDVHVPDR